MGGQRHLHEDLHENHSGQRRKSQARRPEPSHEGNPQQDDDGSSIVGGSAISLVRVYIGQNEMDAHHLQGILQERGITVTVIGN